MTGTDTGGEQLSKFAVQCSTRLVDYLGDHQCQVFYAGLLIDSIHTPTGSRAPIRIGIGQSVPVDLTDRHGARSSAELVLAMPIYFFKREHEVRTCSNQTNITLRNNTNTDITPTTARSATSPNEAEPEHSGGCQPSADRSALKCPVDDGQVPLRTFVSLATIIVYFPVSHMSSANNLCTAADHQKRFHLPPHPHEFVAYPNTITLPVEELGDRIVWGFQHIDTLFSNSLELPSELLVDHFTWDNRSCKSKQTTASSDTTDECKQGRSNAANDHQDVSSNQIPAFAVVSRGVYNRLCTIQRIRSEGISLTQLQKPTTTAISKLWYSKVLFRPESIARSIPSVTVSEVSHASSTDSHALDAQAMPVSFLRWSGLRVSSTEPHTNRDTSVPAKDVPIHENKLASVDSIPPRTCRVVFVRRQSFDCNKAIDSNLLSLQFSPAKLRRTRVRGTIHCGIKLKRRCMEVDSVHSTANTVETNNCLVPPHAVIKRLCGENGSVLCILTPNPTPGSQYPESPGWYTAFHSHTSDDSRSPTNPMHSSIAARVKRGSQIVPQVNLRPTQPLSDVVDNCLSQLNDTVIDDFVNDVLMRPRNRAPPRRFDLTDQDLELALKRSLIEQTPLRKRKEIEPNDGADMQQPMNGCIGREAECVGKSTPRNGKRRRYLHRNGRRKDLNNHRCRRVRSVRMNGSVANANAISEENAIQIKEDCTKVMGCNEQFKSSMDLTGTNTFPAGQGTQQLSCTVTNPLKFIPKLKLAKRRDGKFRILRLARKHIERNCSIKSRAKLHKQSTKCDSKANLCDDPNKDVKQIRISTPEVPPSLSVSYPNSTQAESGSSFYLSPLNLITHNRNPNSNASTEEDHTLVNEFTTFTGVQDFHAGWRMPHLDLSCSEIQSANENVPLLYESKDGLTPLTMWTKLKTPLPAPEPQLQPLPSFTTVTTINPETTAMQTNSVLSATPREDSNYCLDPTLCFHYPGQADLMNSTLLATSVSGSITRSLTDLTPGYVTISSCKSSGLDTLPSSMSNSSEAYGMINCLKHPMEPCLPAPSVPMGSSCYPPPLGACATSVSTDLSMFSLPVKQHVPDAFPQHMAPVMLPSFISPWPLTTRGSYNLAQENLISMGNPGDGRTLHSNNVNSLCKIENVNTMFFVQPTVSNLPFDCTSSSSNWSQLCDVNSWPVIPSYPPVQFIT